MLDYSYIYTIISGATIKNKVVHIDDDSTDITEENYQTIDSISGSYPTPEEHTEGIYSIIIIQVHERSCIKC